MLSAGLGFFYSGLLRRKNALSMVRWSCLGDYFQFIQAHFRPPLHQLWVGIVIYWYASMDVLYTRADSS